MLSLPAQTLAGFFVRRMEQIRGEYRSLHYCKVPGRQAVFRSWPAKRCRFMIVDQDPGHITIWRIYGKVELKSCSRTSEITYGTL